MAAHLGAPVLAQLSLDAQPRPVLAPGAEGLIGRLPMRQIMRHQPPGTAAAPHILDASEDFPDRVLAGSAPRRLRGQQGSQDVPLLIGQVSSVGQSPGGHGRLASHRYREHALKRLNVHYTPF